MTKLFLLLGGNQGNKALIFKEAMISLEKSVGKIIKRSSIYETEPWGFKSDDYFWNQVLIVCTELSPEEVLQHTKRIEKELGRIRTKERYCSRTIDIDMLFYDDLVLHSIDLELPHRRIIDRRFVLEPLAEVAPLFYHPVFKQTIAELLENCSDTLLVSRIDASV